MAVYSAIDSKLISPLLLAKHRAVLRKGFMTGTRLRVNGGHRLA
jgi:hypothetical protein